jgi:hypothetical protein
MDFSLTDIRAIGARHKAGIPNPATFIFIPLTEMAFIPLIKACFLLVCRRQIYGFSTQKLNLTWVWGRIHY